jgi:hypothetical protein
MCARQCDTAVDGAQRGQSHQLDLFAAQDVGLTVEGAAAGDSRNDARRNAADPAVHRRGGEIRAARGRFGIGDLGPADVGADHSGSIDRPAIGPACGQLIHRRSHALAIQRDDAGRRGVIVEGDTVGPDQVSAKVRAAPVDADEPSVSGA